MTNAGKNVVVLIFGSVKALSKKGNRQKIRILSVLLSKYFEGG
jgi:hypothetical protein